MKVDPFVRTDSGSYSKCELYQIRLHGIAIISSAILETNLEYTGKVKTPSRRSVGSWNTYPSRSSGGVLNEKVDDVSYLYESSSLNRQMNDDTQQTKDPNKCPIELSDFNPYLGTTGEFDGFLRMKSTCSKRAFPTFLNSGEHLS